MVLCNRGFLLPFRVKGEVSTMGTIWYLSPSNQSANLGVGNYGNERDQMYALVHEITPHLDRAGVSFYIPERTKSIEERCRESNGMEAKFHFALHSNAGGNGKARGPVAFYYSDGGKVLCDKLVAGLLALGQENNRANNVLQWKGLYELRNTTAPACLLEVDFHDSESGVEFLTKRRKEIGQAIAKVIIEADGREFVPVTPGEYVDRAVDLGLFARDTDWKGPLTREEAAVLAVKLKDLLESGVNV